MKGSLMTITPSQPDSPCFYELCDKYGLDAPVLEAIAHKAGVDKGIMENMYMYMPVALTDAKKLLLAFSEHVGESYTPDMVKVAQFPTFEVLCITHKLDLAYIATHAGVDPHIIDKLLLDEPVPKNEVRLVLSLISRLSGQEYTLGNVEVRLEKEVCRG
jgi:hypothetical protein